MIPPLKVVSAAICHMAHKGRNDVGRTVLLLGLFAEEGWWIRCLWSYEKTNGPKNSMSDVISGKRRAMLHLKMDGWNKIVYFRDGQAVSFRECKPSWKLNAMLSFAQGFIASTLRVWSGWYAALLQLQAKNPWHAKNDAPNKESFKKILGLHSL